MRKSGLIATTLVCVVPLYAVEPIDSLLQTIELQNVEVVSTRAGKHTPVAYTEIDKKTLAQLNYGQDIPQLLSLTPSVTVTSDAGNGIGYTSIRVRGIDPSRINITANGIPMNDAESAQVYFVNMGDFASSLQSMQVQRGVGTSTNGSGAFGASINMQTEPVGLTPYVGVDMSAGSYYSNKETLRFGTGLLSGHWGLQGRLSHIGSHGYLERAHTQLYSYFAQAGYFSDNTIVKFLTFNGSEETYHAWNYASKYEQSLYGRRYNSCGEYYDEEGNTHYYKNQTDNYHQQNYQLIWDQYLTNYWSLSTALHYTKGHGYYEEYKVNKNYVDYGLSDTKLKSDLVRQKKMDNDFYGIVASANFNNRNNLKATLGGGWNKYDGQHFGLVTWAKNAPRELASAWKYYDNTAWKTDFNLYGKAEWEFVRGLNAYADVQYRHVGYRLEDPADWWIGTDKAEGLWGHDDFDFLNPKVGLNYQIDKKQRLYVSYALSHKEPTRNDYQDNYTNHLNAERLQDVELGYKFESPRFSAGVNLYYMYYNHQYVLTGELNDIGEMIASNDNSGSSYRSGIELEAAYKPVKWFRWDANLTLSRNRNKNWTVTLDNVEENDGLYNLGSTHTSFSPDAIFNNIFTFTLGGFTASVQSRYVGEQYMTNTNAKYYVNYNEDGTRESEVSMMLDDFFTTNLNLSYTFDRETRSGRWLRRLGMKSATLGITLYNLFDTRYDTNGWAAPWGYRRTQDGRVEAYCEGDLYEAGFAPAAPFNWMAHISLNF
jgi:iron complex outermembrane receptor protein